ncbi:MAG TPA: hypothetical protein VKD69_24930 [Vicinamibacterales bacterium]|nr:hypothetical protein [Vicinamibacterales bacterium]
MSGPRTLASSEDIVFSSASSVSSDGEGAIDNVILTCPRCGHVDRMLASSYALWSEGILCGLCGPPYVKMLVRNADNAIGG